MSFTEYCTENEKQDGCLDTEPLYQLFMPLMTWLTELRLSATAQHH